MEIIPCNEKGKEFTEADDVFVEDPESLKGKTISFVVKIVSARGLPNKFTVSAWIDLSTPFFLLSLTISCQSIICTCFGSFLFFPWWKLYYSIYRVLMLILSIQNNQNDSTCVGTKEVADTHRIKSTRLTFVKITFWWLNEIVFLFCKL